MYPAPTPTICTRVRPELEEEQSEDVIETMVEHKVNGGDEVIT